MKKLSVVLPVYNASEFIEASIESILNQSFKNFELIVINDGSKDNSLEIIKKFDDKRIVLVDQENKGLAKTLNIGLKLSQGEYIARMDADDICLPNRFEKQVEYLDLNKEYALIGSGIEIINENNEHVSYHAPYIGHDKLVSIMRTKGNPFKHPTIMFRRREIVEIGGYNELIGKYFEDYFLWNEVAKFHKVDNLPMVLLKYRISNNSIMSEFQSSKWNKFVVDCMNIDVFDVVKVEEMKRLLIEAKSGNTKVVRGEKYQVLNMIVDFLYKIFGNSIIKMISYLKSY